MTDIHSKNWNYIILLWLAWKLGHCELFLKKDKKFGWVIPSFGSYPCKILIAKNNCVGPICLVVKYAISVVVVYLEEFWIKHG